MKLITDPFFSRFDNFLRLAAIANVFVHFAFDFSQRIRVELHPEPFDMAFMLEFDVAIYAPFLKGAFVVAQPRRFVFPGETPRITSSHNNIENDESQQKHQLPETF